MWSLLRWRLPVLENRNRRDGCIFDLGVNQKSTIGGYVVFRHPTGDGPPDLVRRIFLNKMDPRYRLLGQRRPPADEVDQPIIGEDRTWLSLQE